MRPYYKAKLYKSLCKDFVMHLKTSNIMFLLIEYNLQCNTTVYFFVCDVIKKEKKKKEYFTMLIICLFVLAELPYP